VIQIKNITLRVSDDFHYSVKTFATNQGKTLQSYMIETIESDLKSNNAFVETPNFISEVLEGLSDSEVLEVIKRAKEEIKNKK